MKATPSSPKQQSDDGREGGRKETGARAGPTQSRADESGRDRPRPHPVGAEGPGAPCTCCHLWAGRAGNGASAAGKGRWAAVSAPPPQEGRRAEAVRRPPTSPGSRHPALPAGPQGAHRSLHPGPRAAGEARAGPRPRGAGRDWGQPRSTPGGAGGRCDTRLPGGPRARARARAEGPPPALTCPLAPSHSGGGATLRRDSQSTSTKPQAAAAAAAAGQEGAGQLPETAPPPRPNPVPPAPGPAPEPPPPPPIGPRFSRMGAAPPHRSPTIPLGFLPSHWAGGLRGQSGVLGPRQLPGHNCWAEPMPGR